MNDNSIKTIKPKIDKKTLEKLKKQLSPEGQVTIHISHRSRREVSLLRVWKTIFLFDNNSEHKSKLLHFYNISLYPEWTAIKYGETRNFTLIFSALPKTCTHFNMVEQIPEEGAWVCNNIPRTQDDIYYLILL
jgi:hypothetical protein